MKKTNDTVGKKATWKQVHEIRKEACQVCLQPANKVYFYQGMTFASFCEKHDIPRTEWQTYEKTREESKDVF